MTIKELNDYLSNSRVPTSEYAINPVGFPDEKLCIVELEDGTWQVFFSERGRKFDVMDFNSEADACDYFARELVG